MSETVRTTAEPCSSNKLARSLTMRRYPI